jgi:hypothetical protein
MIFAILFILAFLLGLVVYLITDKWLAAVVLSMVMFLITTLSDSDAQDGWLFTLIFGLPIVFVASLLGAYVVAIRRGEDDDVQSIESSKSTEDTDVTSSTEGSN